MLPRIEKIDPIGPNFCNPQNPDEYAVRIERHIPSSPFAAGCGVPFEIIEWENRVTGARRMEQRPYSYSIFLEAENMKCETIGKPEADFEVKKASALKIVKQGGSCMTIPCSTCPGRGDGRCQANGEKLGMAKSWLARHGIRIQITQSEEIVVKDKPSKSPNAIEIESRASIRRRLLGL